MLLLAPALAAAAPVVDATRLLSLANPEVIGMGGAGIGFATGANGTFFQPAAPASRKVENRAPVTASLALNRLGIAPARPADLGNLGTAGEWSGAMTRVGGALAYHNAGLGVAVSALDYGTDTASVVVSEGHVSAGGALLDGHLAFGTGWRFLSFDATVGGRDVSYVGSGFETGVSIDRVLGGWNLGAVVRTPIRAERDGGSLTLPVDGVAVPWEVGVGVGWQDAEGDRRHPLRLAADVVFDGPVAEGVSLEAALLGEERTRGAETTIEPHLGLEATVIPDRLRWRVGGYVEPGRTLTAEARPHGTTGAEVRLFHFDLLHLVRGDLSWAAAVDVAPRYLNVAWLGIRLWQSGVVGTGWAPPAAID